MRSTGIGVVVAVMVAAAPLWAGDAAPVLNYSLEDQFGTTHTHEDCGDAVVVLLGGDRKGSSYIDQWGPALYRALEQGLNDQTVCSVGFAHLKGAPFFVKKKIVASFPEDPDAWTLLDWKGEISKKWGAEKDSANLYVFDRDGDLVHHVSLRDFDEAVLESIVDVVEKAVAEK